MSNDFREFLRKRFAVLEMFLKVGLAALEIEKRQMEELLRTDRSGNGVDSSTRHIRAPSIAGKTHLDLVIELVKEYPNRLREEELVDCLEPVIETKAKNRRKAVMDAISLLVRSGRIQKLYGVYRLVETADQWFD